MISNFNIYLKTSFALYDLGILNEKGRKTAPQFSKNSLPFKVTSITFPCSKVLAVYFITNVEWQKQESLPLRKWYQSTQWAHSQNTEANENCC